MSPAPSRIRLAPLVAGDRATLFRWINDRDLVLHSAPFKPVSRAQHNRWFESVQRSADVAIFGIRLRRTNELIGYCQLRAIHPVHRNAELQIRLGATREWGKGYGTEAVHRLLEFAFQDRNLHRVYLQVLSSNAAAVGLYRKAGFFEEGRMRDAAFIGGRYQEVLLMAVINPEGAKAGREPRREPVPRLTVSRGSRAS